VFTKLDLVTLASGLIGLGSGTGIPRVEPWRLFPTVTLSPSLCSSVLVAGSFIAVSSLLAFFFFSSIFASLAARLVCILVISVAFIFLSPIAVLIGFSFVLGEFELGLDPMFLSEDFAGGMLLSLGIVLFCSLSTSGLSKLDLNALLLSGDFSMDTLLSLGSPLI
jgi:hypothetical protein